MKNTTGLFIALLLACGAGASADSAMSQLPAASAAAQTGPAVPAPVPANKVNTAQAAQTIRDVDAMLLKIEHRLADPSIKKPDTSEARQIQTSLEKMSKALARPIQTADDETLTFAANALQLRITAAEALFPRSIARGPADHGNNPGGHGNNPGDHGNNPGDHHGGHGGDQPPVNPNPAPDNPTPGPSQCAYGQEGGAIAADCQMPLPDRCYVEPPSGGRLYGGCSFSLSDCVPPASAAAYSPQCD